MNRILELAMFTATIAIGMLTSWSGRHEVAVADDPPPPAANQDQKTVSKPAGARGANADNFRAADPGPGLFNAVRALNDKIGKLQIDILGDRQVEPPEGRSLAPLTVDEVVKSLRNWDREKTPVDDAVFQIYQKIAESKTLPPRAELCVRTQWIDPDPNDKYQYQVLLVDLDVMTGGNAGYTYRIRDQRLGQRVALRPRPGYEWIVGPQPPLRSNRALTNNGLVYLMEEDRSGALVVIVTRPIKTAIKILRVVAFDAQGNGHAVLGTRLASLEVNTEKESVIERFRLDPEKLPRGEVQYVGFEATAIDVANDVGPK